MGIKCGSQLPICELPIRLDTYRGCSHHCKYCYVTRTGKYDLADIRSDSCLKSLKQFVSGKRTVHTAWCDWDIPLHWGGISDPFQPVERKYRNSLEILRVFAETGYPFVVSTKGQLVAEPDYLELLGRCNCVVQISMLCDAYDKLERGAPGFEERLKMLERVAKRVPRVIVRMQPYMPETLNDVIANIPRLASAGAYGVTIEGIKFFTKVPHTVRVAGDWCYPTSILKLHFATIRHAVHDAGMSFYCAENRLRSMGDASCCCGIDGLPGFKGNSFNLYSILKGIGGDKATPAMKVKGTGTPFDAILQTTIASRRSRANSFEAMMHTVAAESERFRAIVGEDV